MRWALPLILSLLWAVPAFAQSDVPSLTAGTSLTGSTIYLAQGGTLNRKLAFDTTMFGVSSNALIINSTVIGSTTITIGGTTATIAGLTLTAPTFTTPALGTPASGNAANLLGLPLSGLAAQATNTVVGNATSGSAVPTALTMTSCSTAGSAVIWTTNTGFGCNTSITAAAVAVGGITGLGTNVGTALAVNAGSSGSFARLGTDAANPTGTIGTAAVNGTALTYMRSDGAPAIPQCSSSTFGACKVDNSTITASGGVISAVGAGSSTVTANSNTETAVTTFAFGTGFNVPGGSSGTAAITLAVIPVTDSGASRTLTGTDGGKLIHMTNGAATTITLPDSATVTSKFGVNLVCDAGCTVNRAGSDTVNGGTSFVVAPKSWASIATDGAGVFLLGLGPGAVTGTGSMVQATSPTLVTPTIGAATATSVNKVALTAPASASTLTIADGKTLTDTSGIGAVVLKGATGGGFAAATNNDLPGVSSLSGTTHSLAPPREYWYCTGTCTVTPPVPAAGYEFCVANNIAVTSVITMAALGSSARYPKTDSSAYGTAGTGTMVAGGAAGDKICLVGLDSTHYNLGSYAGTWTVN